MIKSYNISNPNVAYARKSIVSTVGIISAAISVAFALVWILLLVGFVTSGTEDNTAAIKEVAADGSWFLFILLAAATFFTCSFTYHIYTFGKNNPILSEENSQQLSLLTSRFLSYSKCAYNSWLIAAIIIASMYLLPTLIGISVVSGFVFSKILSVVGMTLTGLCVGAVSGLYMIGIPQLWHAFKTRSWLFVLIKGDMWYVGILLIVFFWYMICCIMILRQLSA